MAMHAAVQQHKYNIESTVANFKSTAAHHCTVG